jgi:transposase-like protein
MSTLWRQGVSCRPRLVLKKGLSGDSTTGFKEFWIHRFLCTRTGLTVSVHPRFSHIFKRFTLAFVIDCLIAIIEAGRSVHSESKRTGVSSRTLRRWRDGFSKAESPAKHACFSMSGLSPPGQTLINLMFNYFRRIGSGDLHTGAAMGMVRLWESFSRPLY